MLEFVVALVIFGTVLLGLVPLVIEYSKAITSLENCNPETGRWLLGAGGAVANYVEPDPRNQHPNVWYYVPSSDDWARKLGASATVSTSPPPPPPPLDPPSLNNIGQVVDDAPAATQYYAEADGQWVPGPTSGYGNGSRVLPPAPVGTTPSIATWTFPMITSGWCEVQATWPAPSDPVNQPWGTAAQYFYSLDGGTTWYSYPVTVNQMNPSITVTDGGYNWYPVMTIYIPPPPPASSTPQLQVRLAGQPAGGSYTVADAVRLVAVQNNVQMTSLTRSFDGTTASVQVTITPYVPRP
jgi:hypothetical protein